MAQDMIDILHMKDGGIIRGVIVENEKGKPLRIQTGRRKIMKIKPEEIDSISQEELHEINVTYSHEADSESGYAAQADMGYLKGQHSEGMDRVHLAIVNSYRYNPYFSLGLGLGLRFYTGPRDILIPVTGNMRLKFLDRKLSPFISVSYGYSFDSFNDGDGIKFTGMGYTFNPSVGLSIQTFRKSYLCAGICLEQQQFVSGPSSSGFFSAAKQTKDFVSSSLGFFFGYGF
jgi:hypothetical protein